MTEFKDQLRAAIGARPDKEVCAILGCSKRTLTNWKTGTITPPVRALDQTRILLALRVSGKGTGGAK